MLEKRLKREFEKLGKEFRKKCCSGYVRRPLKYKGWDPVCADEKGKSSLLKEINYTS